MGLGVRREWRSRSLEANHASVCVHMCACVCVRREGRSRSLEANHASVCVCVHVCVCVCTCSATVLGESRGMPILDAVLWM